MHSLWRMMVVGGMLGVARGAVIAPTITPAPTVDQIDLLVERQDSPDAISLAQILLTAIPASLRQIAATNIPAVSSILWEEFLDDKRPEWFEELPEEIQGYLVRQFGPKTAWPTQPPASTGWEWPSATATETSEPGETSWSQSQSQYSSTGASESESATVSAPTESPASSPTTFVSSRKPTSTRPTESSLHSSAVSSSSPTSSDADPSTTPSSTSTPDSPPASSAGLSTGQKVGLGLGIPLGLAGAAALFLSCCALLRRRRKKHVDGSVPPSSPGFIPRFAFQERSVDDVEHRTPLNRAANHSTQDLSHTVDWDDEGVDPMDTTPMHNPYVMNNPYAMNDYGSIERQDAAMAAALNDPAPVHHSSSAGMTMHDPTPIIAPALFHTHSSNRARGMRTSYTSLRSVAEETEPDETESPVLGRQTSPPRKLLPTPPIPAGATIKRKPVSVSPPPMPASPPISASPAANAASRKLLRQTMPEHSGSSSSGLALTTSSGFTSTSSGLDAHNNNEAASPVSPLSARAPSYPFNYDSYVEDYGPEYANMHVDVENGLYGGHTSLSRYPESRRKSSKTEWPLRNMIGSGHRRKSSSPVWDRVYEE